MKAVPQAAEAKVSCSDEEVDNLPLPSGQCNSGGNGDALPVAPDLQEVPPPVRSLSNENLEDVMLRWFLCQYIGPAMLLQ
ncbi:hypothetical protein CDL15_Pgr017538 [Punica granatum]|uniref:Uncharacterized protein n=1 Tax=Punica granatum TaxID=22663 RepID=A0A218W6P5_PUNGR|nr:hypothetical protein CDL15_Pgr017538 [Punica granatum]